MKERRILKRIRERPVLDEDFKNSNSVYYRKGGNESVVGSGTYGKVYKGIHVYTKSMVALKKIRMEGEKDGVSGQSSPTNFVLLTLSVVSRYRHTRDQAVTVA